MPKTAWRINRSISFSNCLSDGRRWFIYVGPTEQYHRNRVRKFMMQPWLRGLLHSSWRYQTLALLCSVTVCHLARRYAVCALMGRRDPHLGNDDHPSPRASTTHAFRLYIGNGCRTFIVGAKSKLGVILQMAGCVSFLLPCRISSNMLEWCPPSPHYLCSNRAGAFNRSRLSSSFFFMLLSWFLHSPPIYFHWFHF